MTTEPNISSTAEEKIILRIALDLEQQNLAPLAEIRKPDSPTKKRPVRRRTTPAAPSLSSSTSRSRSSKSTSRIPSSSSSSQSIPRSAGISDDDDDEDEESLDDPSCFLKLNQNLHRSVVAVGFPSIEFDTFFVIRKQPKQFLSSEMPPQLAG